MKIAIKRTMGLGDVILAQGIVAKYKELYPDSIITFYTAKNRSCFEMLNYLPGIDNKVAIESEEFFNPNYLDNIDADIKVDLDNLEIEPYMTYMESYAKKCKFNVKVIPKPIINMGRNISDELNHVIIASEASGWANKEWQLSKYKEIARYIKTNTHLNIVEPGAYKYTGLANIENRMKSIHILLQSVKSAKAYIGGDCGIMHIASAFNIPMFVIIGGVHPIYTLHKAEKIMCISKLLNCIGCIHKRNINNNYRSDILRCDNNVKYECMRNLTTNEVLPVLEIFLRRYVYGNNKEI